MPLAASRVPDKVCTERTIGIFEGEIDLIADALAAPQRLRKTSAEYINPMRDIAFTHIVITNHGHRFVLRLGSVGIGGSHLVNFKELVVKNSFGFKAVRSRSTHQLPAHRPVANYLTKQRVGEYRVGAIDWLLTGSQSWKNEQHNCQAHA